MTENEWIIDLLIEFDEMGFIPTTTVPDPKRYAVRWRDRMCQALKGYRNASEVINEIIELLTEVKEDYLSTDEIREASAVRYAIGRVEEFKNKYGGKNNDGE